MVFIPHKAPADARWWRSCVGASWSDAPCARTKLNVGMNPGGNFDGVAEFSMINGYGKARYSSTVCSSSGWIVIPAGNWLQAYVDIWGAFDAGDWTSSVIITMKMSNPVVRTITPFARVYAGGACAAIGTINGTSRSTVTTVVPSCSVVPDTVFTVTAYDDGSFTVA